MTSLYIRLSKAAIKNKLTKNENLIFHTLMVQTLGYRKSFDNLTDKRLAYLAGLRSDHFRVALDSFLQHNLFYRIEHQYYDYQYRICDEFLDDDPNATIFPPSLPKTGKDSSHNLEASPKVGSNSPQNLGESSNIGENSSQNLEKLPEIMEHTTENLYIKKPQQQTTQTEQKPKTQKKPTDKTKKKTAQETPTEPQVSISFIGLETLPEQMIINSSQPVRLEFSAKETTSNDKQIEPVATIQPVAKTEPEPEADVISVPTTLAEEANVTPEPSPEPEHPTAATESPIIELVEPFVTEKKEETINTANPPAKPRPLPEAISAAYISDCRRYFDPLTDQQQQDVLTVFDQQLKAGTIKSNHRYFIGLAKKVQQGGLSVTHKEKHTGANKPAQYSPEYFAAEKEANKDREQRARLWSHYQYLKQQAALYNKSEQEIANMMGMEDAYAAFGQQQPLSTTDAVIQC